MDQGIGMSQIIQEFVTQSPTLVRTWYETGNIQKFDRHGSPSFHAPAVVRLTPI